MILAAAPARAELKWPYRSVAETANVVVDGSARFTVLSATLIRLEYAEDGQFEDRASYFAVERGVPVQEYTQRRADGWLEIETERLRLRYKTASGRFGSDNLSIRVANSIPTATEADPDSPPRSELIEWKPGLPNAGNLGGTVRTLDGCRGPIDLGHGVLSRDGWYLHDDSKSILLAKSAGVDRGTAASDTQDSGLSTQHSSGWPVWAEVRRPGDRIDWYFFGYGHDFATALSDLTTVGGKIPLPPRFALGSWYSRYWPYTTEDFLKIADDYNEQRFPLDVMVIDMDWHLDGWTGYTWNPKLIPDPEALLKGLHERGLKATLNLHPADGVGPQERAYKAFARAMGQDPAAQKPVKFDIADPKFARHYFELLLHPLEARGVDFWWMDWQQERTTSIPGLDPLPWLNHLHFLDRQRLRGSDSEHAAATQPSEALRGLCFSRWGGWGDHRHPIQFSGDTESSWAVLKFLVPFTATAGNVGAAYGSHDLGGHWSSTGRVDGELYARWLQFGAFSPAMRVHSTRDADNDRRPWLYEPEITNACRYAYDLRYRLMPYVYTMARKCYDTGLPLVRPMYLIYPHEPRAYETPGQFMFGDDLLVAPAVEPGYGRARMVDVFVWFPPGEWYNLLTHERYVGPSEALVTVELADIPVFARGGAPIPMNPPKMRHTSQKPDALFVRLYPGSAVERHLYEDDTESAAYQRGAFRRLPIHAGPAPNGEPQLAIGPANGTLAGASETTPAVELELPSRVRPRSLTLSEASADGSESPLAWTYDSRRLMTTVGLGAIPVTSKTAVTWAARADAERTKEARHAFALMHRIARGLAQLPREHPQTAALTDAAQTATAYCMSVADPTPDNAKDRAGGVIVRTRIESAVAAAMRELAKGESDDDAAALRAMTGVSLHASVAATADPALIHVVATLRERPRTPGEASEPVTVKLHVTGASEFHQREVEIDEHGMGQAQFDVRVDPDRLVIVRGDVSAERAWQNLPIPLKATFEWRGTAIRDWVIVGPMPGGKGPQAEQLGPEKELDFSARYPGVAGSEVVWVPYHASAGEAVDGFTDVVNFRRAFNVENATAFAATTLVSPADATVDFLLRHDDGAILWVNGVERYRSVEPRGLGHAEARIKVSLHEGENTVLLKVEQLRYGWAFRLSLDSADSAALSNLRVQVPTSR